MYFGLSPHQLGGLALIFIRVTTLVMFMPFFSSKMVPAKFKIGFSFFLSLILWNLFPATAFPENLVQFLLYAIEEVLIGFAIGLMITFFFAAIQFAGQFIGIKIGFAIVNVYDPETSEPVSIIAQFFYILSVLLFFSLDGPAYFIRALYETFEKIPIGVVFFSGKILNIIVHESVIMFEMAVKISAPVIVVILLVNIGLGAIAKAVPQINIFIVGMPLNISIGLMTLYVSLLTLLSVFSDYLIKVFSHIFKLIPFLGG